MHQTPHDGADASPAVALCQLTTDQLCMGNMQPQAARLLLPKRRVGDTSLHCMVRALNAAARAWQSW